MRMLKITSVLGILSTGVFLLAPAVGFADGGEHRQQRHPQPTATSTQATSTPQRATTTTSIASTTKPKPEPVPHATTTRATTTQRTFSQGWNDFLRFLNPTKQATATPATTTQEVAKGASASVGENPGPSLLANLRTSLGLYQNPSTTTYPSAPYTPGERNAMLGGAGILGALGFALRIVGRH